MKIATLTYAGDRLAANASDLFARVDAAIAAGMVPNKLYVDAKDTFNRAAEQAAEAFLKTGPHIVGRNGQAHDQSDWWLAAYDADAFVRGTHTLPTVLKRAQKADLTDYAAFIGDLMPMRDLLEAAKPLIVKKGDMPKVKTAKQLADEADQMTCQCCGRGIFAATGTIAHHGYERPGHGWQTASCMGAKEMPFEVSRDCLGRMIVGWRGHLASMQRYAIKLANRNVGTDAMTPHFVKAKAKALTSVMFEIENITSAINEQQARYNGWKQTHQRVGAKWVEV